MKLRIPTQKMTPEEIEAENRRYKAMVERNKEKIKKLIFSPTISASALDEVLDALLKYHDEYNVECFDEINLEY